MFCSPADGKCQEDDNNAATDPLCGEDLPFQRVIPNVVMMVDGSGSMRTDKVAGSEAFNGGQSMDRWEFIRFLMLGVPPSNTNAPPGGIINQMQSQMGFSFAGYWFDDHQDAKFCITLHPNPLVFPKQDYAAVRQQWFSAAPKGEAPQSHAINAVVNHLDMQKMAGQSVTIALVTDGESETCGLFNPKSDADKQRARDLDIQAVTNARNKGITTEVIGIGAAVDPHHLDAMARVGLNRNDATAKIAQNAGDLQTIFNNIVRDNVSCTLALDGKKIDTSRACSGKVWLQVLGSDGKVIDVELPCLEPSQDLGLGSGWTLIDATTIRIVGQGCELLRKESVREDNNPNYPAFKVNFPCVAIQSS